MIKAEFHTHTFYSYDSLLNKYAYLFMLKLRNIKVIAVTDHNTTKGAFYLKPFLNKFGIDVIVGEEIFTSHGEIIGLFLTEDIKPGLSPEETIEKIKSQNGLVYIPHPYDEKRYKTVLQETYIEKFKESIDLIEIHNGRNTKENYSIKQKEMANKYNITNIVGSDAHTFFELGRNYVLINKFNNKEEFLQNIKTAKFIQKKSLSCSHHVTKFVKLFKLLKKGKINEIYRIFKRKITK